MTDWSRRLKDLLHGEPDREWCATTRLANPWSVLFGGTRRREPPPSDASSTSAGTPGHAGADRREDGTGIPGTDLRATLPPAGKDGGA
jgi:hypothetical protein